VTVETVTPAICAIHETFAIIETIGTTVMENVEEKGIYLVDPIFDLGRSPSGERPLMKFRKTKW